MTDLQEMAERGRGKNTGCSTATKEQEDTLISAAPYEEVLASHRRLVRELDVLLNGEEGAAQQASLCDIVSQVRLQGFAIAAPLVEEIERLTGQVGLMRLALERIERHPEWTRHPLSVIAREALQQLEGL
jgi:hypothetical protein